MKLSRLITIAGFALSVFSCAPVQVADPDSEAVLDSKPAASLPTTSEELAEKPEAQTGPAGILLYCRHQGEIHLLLANDRLGRRGWGGFGGGEKKGETTAMTAARETSEETRGYYDAVKLYRQISSQKPHQQWGYFLYFLEVPHVPASRIMNHSIPLLNPAYMETQHYAWVPWSEIQPLLRKRNPTAADLRLHPRHLQVNSRSRSYWSVWIDNMRRATQEGALPWYP